MPGSARLLSIWLASCLPVPMPALAAERVIDAGVTGPLPVSAGDVRRFLVPASQTTTPAVHWLLRIEQVGIDVTVTCASREGDRRLPLANAATGRVGFEVLLLDAGSPWSCAMTPRLLNGVPDGQVKLDLVELNAGQSVDGLHIEDWRQWHQAHMANATETSAGRELALHLLTAVRARSQRSASVTTILPMGFAIAQLQRRLGRLEAAVAGYSWLLEWASTPLWQSRIINARGLSQLTAGRLDPAQSDFERAAQLAALAPVDGSELASARSNLCLVLQHRGDWLRVPACLQRAIATYDRYGEREHGLVALANLAATHERMGASQLALNAYQELRDARRSSPDPQPLALLLTNFAALQGRVGDFDLALGNFQQAEQLLKAAGARGTLASTYRLHGELLAELGQNERATHYIRQALAWAGQYGDMREQGLSLGLLAGLEPHRRTAIWLRLRAFVTFARSGHRIETRSQWLGAIGDLLDGGERRTAERLLMLAQAQEGGLPAAVMARRLLLSARLACADMQWKHCQASADAALRMGLPAHDTEQVLEAHRWLALAQLRGGQFRLAADTLASARQRLKQDRQRLTSPRLSAQWSDRHLALRDLELEVLLNEPDVAADARCMALLAMWARDHSASTPVLRPTRRHRQLLRDYQGTVHQLRLLNPQRDGALVQLLTARWLDLEAKLDLAERQTLDRAPDFVGTAQAAPADPTGSAAGAAVVWLVGERGSAAVILTPGAGMQLIRLPARAEFARALPTAADGPSRTRFDAISEMHAPMFALLSDVSRVALYPDGPLFGTAFAAWRSAPGRYWIQTHVLAVHGSGWPARPRETVLPSRWTVTSLLLDLPRGATGLAGVQAELAGLTALLGVRHRQLKLSASREIDEPGLLHIAGHGWVSLAHPEAALLSALAPQAGQLRTPRGISAVDLRLASLPRLVVLNACDAAAAQYSPSQSPLNLARSVQTRTASAVIAPIVAVPDQQAARIGIALVQALETGADPALALALAQRQELTRPDPLQRAGWSAYVFLEKPAVPTERF